MQTWRDTLEKDRLELALDDYKPALNAMEAETEANRCINCYGAPCINACPTGINIPQFISRIASDNVMGAAKTILDSNILGHSCANACPTEVLCEGACVYNSLNKKAIQIGRLQRFAVEQAYSEGKRFYTAGEPTGKKIALVGAGPASLACAHELRKQGHEAVVFEKSKLPGGLNTSGIAPYKMKAQTSLREIEEILALGVRIEYEKELGRDFTLATLLKEYDAVFLGLGLGSDSRIEFEGSDLPAVRGAVEWIAEMKLTASSLSATSQSLSTLRTALVVGGGNTALDACRELKKLGVPRVIVSYRRGESDMSGYVHELKAARQEGVEFWFHTLPARFESKKSGLRAQLKKTAPGIEETMDMDTDLVLMATGQSKLQNLLCEAPEFQAVFKFEKGVLQTDPATGRTGHPRIFAGGDLSNGGKEVVNAVAEGKLAALSIDRSLKAIPAGASSEKSKGAKNG